MLNTRIFLELIQVFAFKSKNILFAFKTYLLKFYISITIEYISYKIQILKTYFYIITFLKYFQNILIFIKSNKKFFKKIDKKHNIWKNNFNTLTIIFNILLLFNNILITSCVCPRLCECKWKSGKESVLCLNANISNIPNNIDTGTQILDLTGNYISYVRHDTFSNLQLVNLQKLIFSKCRLKLIERFAFRELNNLIELDLSYNRLIQIPSHTFDFTPELREIRLSGNPIQIILNDAFVRVPKLTRIELSNCNISRIELKAFRGIEQSLEWLKLNGNSIIQVLPETFSRLKNLHGLELAQNLWNCSCFLRPLRLWMIQEKIPYNIPPTCQSPSRLYNKSWDKIDLDDFACLPNIMPNQITVYGVEGNNVTLSCFIQDNGETNIQWILNNRLIAKLNYTNFKNLQIKKKNNESTSGILTSFNQDRKFMLINLIKSISNLSISIVEQRDSGIYTCIAENKAGRSEAHITLIVSRKFMYLSFGKSLLFLCLFTIILLMALLTLIGLWKFTNKNSKKHFLLWNNISSRCNSYEKIEMAHNNNILSNNNTNQISGIPVELNNSTNNNKNKTHSIMSKNKPDDSKIWKTIDNVEENINKFESNTSINSGNISNINQNVIYLDDINFGENSIEEEIKNFKDFHLPWIECTTSSSLDYTYCSSKRKKNKKSDFCKNSNEPYYDIDYSRLDGISDINSIFNLAMNSKDDITKSSARSYNSQLDLLHQDYNNQNYPKIVLDKNFKYLLTKSLSSDVSPSKEFKNKNIKRSNSTSSIHQKTDDNNCDSFKIFSHRNYNDIKPHFSSDRNCAYNNILWCEKETPLLNFSSYVPGKTNTNNINHRASTISLSDMHSAQLERFLQEYNTLQEQLRKIKETCEEICKKETAWKTSTKPSIEFDDCVIFNSALSESSLQISSEIKANKSLYINSNNLPSQWVNQNQQHKLIQNLLINNVNK